MIPKIQKDFLLLFQCIIDVGAEVLRDFTEEKIKTNYNTDDFGIFLGKTKHHFYHQSDKKKLPCCECPSHGCSIPTTGKMDKKIFDKLYPFNSSMKWPKGHIKRNDGCIIQNCICRLNANISLIEDLDLSDLNALLKGLPAMKTPMISPIEAQLISDMMTVRGKVCHAVSTTTFSEPDLINLWGQFTNALYNLYPGQPKHVKWLKKSIETSKKTILSDEEIKELMSTKDMLPTMKDVAVDIKTFIKNNASELKNCVIKESTGIKTLFDNTIPPLTEEQERHSKLLLESKNLVCQTVSNTTKNMMTVMEKEGTQIRDHSTGLFQTLENKNKEQGLNTQEFIVTKVSEEGEKTRKYSEEKFLKLEKDNLETKMMIGRLEQIVGSLPVHVRTCLADIQTTPVIDSAVNRNIQLQSKITLASMTDSNEQKIIQSLNEEIHVDNVDGKMEKEQMQKIYVKAKKVNSIELELAVTAGIFKNTETLRRAILTLVKTVIVTGEVDTSKKDPIHLLLKVDSPLSEDEKATVVDLLTKPEPNRSHGDIIETIEEGNEENSVRKDQNDSVVLNTNKTKVEFECLLELENKAKEVACAVLEHIRLKGQMTSSSLMRHKHPIFHMYTKDRCCQCNYHMQNVSPDFILTQKEFETMFEEVKHLRKHPHHGICICFWKIKRDITEKGLPFPVMIYLLTHSLIDRHYKDTLQRIVLTTSEINDLGNRHEKRSFYKLWKSLSNDILYMASAISEQFKAKIETEIMAVIPNLSPYECIVLNSMHEMKAFVADKFATLHKDIHTDMLRTSQDARAGRIEAQSLKSHFQDELYRLRADFGKNVQGLGKEIREEIQKMKAYVGERTLIREMDDLKPLPIKRKLIEFDKYPRPPEKQLKTIQPVISNESSSVGRFNIPPVQGRYIRGNFFPKPPGTTHTFSGLGGSYMDEQLLESDPYYQTYHSETVAGKGYW